MSALKRSLDEVQGAGEEGVKKIKADDGSEEKAAELFEIRVLIDNYEASVIIGKAGSNVKMVRTESGSFVSILKTDSPVSKERVMTIKGSEENIATAMKIITQLLIDAANTRKQTDPNGAGELETQYSLKVLIHKFLAGSIIGKAGAIIREIQETTKARVQLSNEPLAGSTEKTVTITGSADVVHAASLRVVTQLSQNPLRAGSTSTLYVPGAAAAAATAYPYGAPPNPYHAPYGAPPAGHAPPQYPPYPGQTPGYGAPPSPYGAPPPPVAGAPGVKVQKIVIPTACAGTVIGKGGSIIRDIKTQSGTSITIADPSKESPQDRVVAITGSQAGISTAIFLIRQRVESYQAPTPPM